MSQSLGTGGAGFGLADAAALFLGLSVLAFLGLRRAALPAREATAADAWWQANMGSCLVLWCLAELPAVLGAVLLFAGGHTAPAGVLIGLGIAALMVLTPGRLSGS